MDNPINIDDLGVPLFLETPRYVCIIPKPEFRDEFGDGDLANYLPRIS